MRVLVLLQRSSSLLDQLEAPEPISALQNDQFVFVFSFEYLRFVVGRVFSIDIVFLMAIEIIR